MLSGGSDSPPQSVNVNAKAPAPQTEQMRDIQAAEKIEGVQSGEVSAEDAYAHVCKINNTSKEVCRDFNFIYA